MTRGRKPKPTAQKQLEGNPGKRPFNVLEPQIPEAALRCPSHLDAIARTEWKRLAPLLKQAKQVTAVDRAVLAGYCTAWSAYVTSDSAVQKYGDVLISEKTGTPYCSPYVNLRSMAMKQMCHYAVELGITPSARSRVKVNVEPRDDDPLFKLLRGRGMTN